MIARLPLRPRTAPLNILDAVGDPQLFASWFKNRASWVAWFAFLASLFALPLTGEQLEIFRACTGRSTAPIARAREAWLVVGRRGGKSLGLALLATFCACFIDWRPYLQHGERAVVMVVAADRKQAAIVLRYIRALLKGAPLLARMVVNERAESIDLSNGASFEVTTSSFRLTRGRAICVACLDELAFWPVDESAAEPDSEIIAAIRPSMAQFGEQALLLCASSPYAKKGELYNAYRKHYGREHDPVLVWKAATRVMNPSISQRIVDEAYERDPVSAAAEFGAEFRSDIESFISREAVEACVARGIFERAPQPGVKYCGFVDPSGGSSDSFTLAIAHVERDGIALLDVLLERQTPFSPENVCADFADTLKSYGVSKIQGDRYAGVWPVEVFSRYGITYEQSADPKSILYTRLLPLINSRRVELLDLPRLTAQLCGLERRTARGGRDSIDHPPSGHDDTINAAAGALLLAAKPRQKIISAAVFCGGLGPGQSMPPTRIFDDDGTVRLIDPVSGKVIYDRDLAGVSALSHLKNGCNPGRGIDSPEIDAMAFNARHNIRRPT